MILRRLQKSKSLRIVNLLGLTVIFTCLLISYSYIKKEFSYDRFHENADRLYRFAVQMDDNPVDGRFYGMQQHDPLITGIAGVEDAVLLEKVNTGVITIDDKSQIINDYYFATSNFFQVFSFPLLQGEKESVLDAPEKVAISQRYARQLFGDTSPIGKELKITSRRYRDMTVFVSGVYEDFPETSHFYTDLILRIADDDNAVWAHTYLLFHKGADVRQVSDQITARVTEEYKESQQKVTPYLMPMTDIHLHSRVQRELEPNGNIYFIRLIIGANLLLLVIVLFNLWLNAGLIFSFNRRYYQLLRLNGASSTVVVRDEGVLAIILGIASILLGGLIAWQILPALKLLPPDSREIGLLSLLFLAAILVVSLLPVLNSMSATMFKSTQIDLNSGQFSLAKVKYMLIAQYCLVMFIVIVSFGISKQINLIKTSQVGGNEQAVLVMKEQPEIVKDRYELLKSELLKYPEISSVTSAMQLPGSAIRDGIRAHIEGESETEGVILPILVVGDDFLPFFDIKPIAGELFSRNPLSYNEEVTMMNNFFTNKVASDRTEEYVINRKALRALGFSSPEEAIGKTLTYEHGGLNYVNKGVIVGVTDDFNYTTTYEESIPQVVFQRKMHQHCILVKFSSDKVQQALDTFNQVWATVNPDYPADYAFLQDIYGEVYRNEFNAETLVRIFSLLCLIIANLGLIIIMAFVVKRKTKEIGVRKVNGATPSNIIRLLNSRFIYWIVAAFVIAIPVSYLVMRRWLENFAYKTSLDWWVFVMAGLIVLAFSLLSISWQSWRAAMLNPIHALKTE